MQKCIWFASVSQDRLLQLLTLECCMVSVLAKHFVRPVTPSSCLGKTVGCGGRVFLLSTRIYRKPFHRTGVFLESDQSSPGIISRWLDTYLAMTRQMNCCQPLDGSRLGKQTLPCSMSSMSHFCLLKCIPCGGPVLYYERGTFSALHTGSVGSAEVSGSPWKLVALAMLTAFLSSFFLNYRLIFDH